MKAMPAGAGAGGFESSILGKKAGAVVGGGASVVERCPGRSEHAEHAIDVSASRRKSARIEPQYGAERARLRASQTTAPAESHMVRP